MVTLGDWISNNANVCPACGSNKLVRDEDHYKMYCKYCGLSIAVEVLYGVATEGHIANVLHELKRAWQHRVKVLKEMGTQALVDELQSRGIHIHYGAPPDSPEPEATKTAMHNLLNQIYAPIINDQLAADLVFLYHESHSEPKPWSYEEAAASEFNLDEGTGLQ